MNRPVELGGCRVAAEGRALLPDQVYLIIARILHNQDKSLSSLLSACSAKHSELHSVTKGKSIQQHKMVVPQCHYYVVVWYTHTGQGLTQKGVYEWSSTP